MGKGPPPSAGAGRRAMSIGTKLITVSTAVIVLVMGIGGAIALSVRERAIVKLMGAEAVRHAQTIKKSLRHHMLANKPEDAQWIVETIGRQKDIDEIRLFNKTGKVMLSSKRENIGTKVDARSEGCTRCHKPGLQSPPDLPPVEASGMIAGEGGKQLIAVMDTIENEPACHACHPARKKILGNLQVLFSFDRASRQLAAGRRELLFSMLLLIALIAAAQAVFTYAQVILPIKRLTRDTERIAAGELPLEVTTTQSDELGDLARRFSLMAKSLREARERDRDFAEELSRKVTLATADLDAANKRLIEADRARSRFVREVSHQLRSQLASVKNCLAVVREGHAATPEKRDDMIARAERKARLLGELVRDLLDLAHIEEGPAARHQEAVRLDAVVERSVESLRWKAEEKGVRLETRLDPGLPAVEADPRELGIMLDNLVDNAIKYSRQDGVVSVRASEERGSLVLSVQDDGIGVPGEDKDRIFEEFYRTSSASAHEKEGTGLGLCIVKRLAEAYGASVEVRSEPDKGSVFTVRFPAKNRPPPSV
ncbi:MAG: HAMP domain-containing protein [Elusimicrobia bacterium]|nr:HAMP domain-containing protein [Elusimicrobiota bacterium]